MNDPILMELQALFADMVQGVYKPAKLPRNLDQLDDEQRRILMAQHDSEREMKDALLNQAIDRIAKMIRERTLDREEKKLSNYSLVLKYAERHNLLSDAVTGTDEFDY